MSKEKKLKVEYDEAVHGEDFAKLVKEASDLKLIMEGYADQIKDIKARAKDELGVEGKLFNQIFRLKHAGTRDRFETETTEAVETYDRLFPAK